MGCEWRKDLRNPIQHRRSFENDAISIRETTHGDHLSRLALIVEERIMNRMIVISRYLEISTLRLVIIVEKQGIFIKFARMEMQDLKEERKWR